MGRRISAVGYWGEDFTEDIYLETQLLNILWQYVPKLAFWNQLQKGRTDSLVGPECRRWYLFDTNFVIGHGCSHLSSWSRQEKEENLFSAKDSNAWQKCCVAFLIARLEQKLAIPSELWSRSRCILPVYNTYGVARVGIPPCSLFWRFISAMRFLSIGDLTFFLRRHFEI
jgi:hypothetical protein